MGNSKAVNHGDTEAQRTLQIESPCRCVSVVKFCSTAYGLDIWAGRWHNGTLLFYGSDRKRFSGPTLVAPI